MTQLQEMRIRTDRIGSRSLLLICGAVLVLLAGWMLVFPYTGEGDSVFHYLIARYGLVTPEYLLSGFGRPMHKLLIIGPAQVGLYATRLMQALMTVALIWQTIRMAEDMELRYPLVAGATLLFQPLVFMLASDTMTEIPTALGITAAIRLWWRGRLLPSCLIVSLLPAVRPEGFFFCAMWGLMLVLRSWRPDQIGRELAWRFVMGVSLATGVALWVLACYLAVGNWEYLRENFWPAKSYEAYGRGPIWWHAARWPDYCGLVLLVLFVAGIWPAMRQKKMRLPWCVWLIVFGTHSVLYWGGWFASVGLMRIMVTISPVTAIVCLYGWNAFARRLEIRGMPSDRRWWLGSATIAAMYLWAVGAYLIHPGRWHCFPIRSAAQYIRENRLLDDAPMFFTGDRILLAELDYPRYTDRLATNKFSRHEELTILAGLPLGTVGVWDNQQAEQWHSVAIEELEAMGYRKLYEARWRAPDIAAWAVSRYKGLPPPKPLIGTQRYAVFRRESMRPPPAE